MTRLLPSVYFLANKRYSKATAIAVGLIAYAWYFAGRVTQADFLVFYASANNVMHHLNPYPKVGSPSVYSGSSFVYPYFSAFLFTPFVALSRTMAQWSFVVVSLVAIVLSLWFFGVRRPAVYALFLLASTTTVSWQMGTVNPLLFFGLALAWRLRNKVVLLGVIVGTVAFVKLFLLPVLLWLALARRFRAFLTSATVFLGLFLGSFIAGPISFPRYLSLLTELSLHEGRRGFSGTSLLRNIGVGEVVSMVVVVGIGVGMLTMVYRLYRTTHQEAVLLAGTIVVSLFLTPILWSSYLVLVGTVLLLILESEYAAIFYSITSWVVVTPDRAGLFAIILVVVAMVCFVVLIVSQVDNFRSVYGRVPSIVREHMPTSRPVVFLLILSIISVLSAFIFFEPLIPAILIQFMLVTVLPMVSGIRFPADRTRV